MTDNTPKRIGPPPRHHLAIMIWIAVFPTLTILNLLLDGMLEQTPMVLRTLILSTIAVPIVIFGLMPPLQRLRLLLLR